MAPCQRDSLRAPYRAPFDIPSMGYAEALPVASDTGFMGSTKGPLLEVVEDMLDMLGRPDRAYDCIQIAGTNGKTSTSRFCAGILRGEGLRTMLYTSPQLVRMNERIEIDGAPVADDAFARGVSAAGEAGQRVNERRAQAGLAPYTISAFDVLTVAALFIAAEQRVDVAVLEVGLGGRWDATSATDPCVVGITGIGLDHVGILGDTLEKIAAEKAAVIKPGRRVVLGEGTHDPAVEAVMRSRCEECGVEPHLSSHELLHRPEGLGDAAVFATTSPHGRHVQRIAKPAYQPQNAACAIALAELYLDRALDDKSLARSLAQTPTPGRFDVVRAEPLVLVDACHNPQSVAQFVSCLDELAPCVEDRPQLLVAALADKDVRGIVELLAPAFPRVVVTSTSSGRALPAEELAEVVRSCGVEPAAVHATAEEAVRALRGQSYVACGSITLAGEVAGLLRG